MTIMSPAETTGAPQWSDSKRALLRRRLAGARDARPANVIPARPDGDPAPLSPAQSGMWAIDQLLEDNSVYSVNRVLRLRGPLDVEALRGALDDLVRRHGVLRTVFQDTVPPTQAAREPHGAGLTVTDLSGLPPAARDKRVPRLVAAETGEPFDLQDGPVFRCVLLILGGDEHLLVLNTHHLVNDEWSCGVLARDLAALYTARVTAAPADLPALPIQYADYASWQAERARGPEYAGHLRWWREQLADTPTALDLPTDFPRPTAPAHRGATVSVRLEPGTSAALRELAAARGVTLFSALLSLFGAALHRWSGQERFAVGTLLSGRGLAQTESLVGLFANTAALPLDFAGRPGFADAAARAHRLVVGALDHQEAAFAEVAASLTVSREAGRNPVYQVMFQCLETEGESWRFGDATVEQVDLDPGTAKVDLTLFAAPGPETVELALNYDTALFAECNINTLLTDLVALVEHAVASPEKPFPEPTRRREAPLAAPLAEPSSPVRSRETAPRSAASSGSTLDTLAGIWADVLGVGAVGPDDDFFELGGDSLLLIHVTARAREAGIPLTARQVFRNRTPAAVAAAIEAADGFEAPAVAPPVDFPLSGLDPDALRGVLADREPAEVADVYRLTALQSGMLVRSLVEPESYLRQFVLTLDEELDPELFQAAWQRAFDRHAVLRSCFRWHDLPHPVQLALTSWRVEFGRADWTGVDAAEQERRLAALLAEARATPFDLSAAPPSRFTLVRAGASRHHLLWSTHHIVFDGWSIPLVLDEVFAAYDAARAGTGAPDRPVAPLRDYLGWLADRPAGADADFWRARLDGFTEPTPVPVFEPVRSIDGADSLVRAVPAELAARLRGYARRRGLSAGAVLHAVWAVLLSRHSGRADVVFGTMQAGRSVPLPGVERIVGPLVNTLPLRVAVDEHRPVDAWLDEVQLALLDVREHEYCALADIQRAVGFGGSHRLFESIFVYTEVRAGSASAGRSGLTVTDGAGEGGNGYPLTMEVRADDEMSLRLTYQRSHYGDAAAELVQEHYLRLLESLVDGAATVGELDMLPHRQRDLLLRQWNDTRRPYPRDTTIPALFQKIARAHAERTALISGDEELSYAELASRAARLSHLLRERGVGLETPVAVAMPRSAGFVVAALGVLGAGGHYVPLDPNNPPDRTAWILADSGARVVIRGSARDAAYSSISADGGLTVIDLDDPETAVELAGLPDTPPPCPAEPDSLVNVLYTSGSTGTPKGVVQVHRGVLRLVHAPVYADAGPGDVFLLFAPVAFDAANQELWWSLLTGATLVVGPPGPVSAAELGRLLRESGVTHMWLSSGLFHQLAQEDVEAFAGVRVMMSGGDVLPPEPVRAVMAAHPDLVMVNGYGPTENTVFTTALVLAGPEDAEGRVSIGTPVPQTSVYVLDDALRPVPIGVTGQLYTSGDGLARGYVRRPGVTAERFVPDPFAADPGARMYATGDLARWRPDGRIEFCGRIDGQVKIRGFRVETGEVESRLERHPAVAAAAVTAREDDGPESKRLVAYLVAAGETRPSVAELRAFLGRDLPDYMVPSMFVYLDRLPVNANGKVDRLRLPAPGPQRPEGIGKAVAPATDTERAIAAVWSRLLGVAEVGREDDFFELGGDSILSLRIAAELRRAGLRVTTRQVFDHHTVADLAAVADASAEPAAPVAEQGPVVGEVPLTPIVHWFTGLDWRHSHFAQSVRLEWAAPPDPRALEQALDLLVRRHDGLRSRLVREGTGWRHRIAAPEGERVSLRLVDAAAATAVERDALVEAESAAAHRGHDLAAGPLLRAVHLNFGADVPEQTVISVHHLAVDTVSWSVLLADLETAYRDLARGAEPRLPAKTGSLPQWSRRLVEYAESEEFAAEAAYWVSRAPSAPELPADDPKGGNAVRDCAVYQTSLPADLTEALLREVSAGYRARVHEVLLTALGLALSGWTGPGSLPVTVEGHGREPLFDDVDVSRTVGWFTSMYPVDLRVEPETAPAAAVSAIKQRLREIPRHGVGYGLARYLAPGSRDVLAARDAARICFNYHGLTSRAGADVAAAPLFRRLDPVGPHTDPDGLRQHEIDVIASVEDGVLHIGWHYAARRFEAATVAGVAERFLDELRALIAGTHAAAAELTAADFPLAGLDESGLDHALSGYDRERVQDVYPLSPSQNGMLFHSLADRDAGAYFIQTVYDLEGALDPDALEAAWSEVCERHPVLRSTFRWDGLRRPLQIVHSGARPAFRHLDWTEAPAGELEERFTRLLAEERARGFDPEHAVPQRFDLIRLAPERHRLVWHFHHLLMDGWSMPLVLAEVAACYRARRAGVPAELPEPVPFREHIAWLERHREVDAAFWSARLAGMTAPTGLPMLAGARTGQPGVAFVETDLDASSAELLRGLCRRLRITAGSALQAAWGLLLSRCSGEYDVVFGSTQAGRSADVPGIDRMVGPLLSTMPVRVVADPEAGVGRWLTAVHEHLQELQGHEHEPLTGIQRHTAVPADQQLFATIFIALIGSLPTPDGDEPGSADLALPALTPREGYEQTGYPLVLSAEIGETTGFRLSYDPSRVTDVAAQRLLGAYRKIVEDLAQRPDARLGRIGGLPEDQAELALDVWNHTAAPLPRRTVLDHVREHAELRPDAVAVVAGDRRLTYRELLLAGERLAHRLRDAGVTRGSLVGVHLGRDAAMPVALVGIMAAGAAYLPLDPAYPADRLSYIVRDSGARLVLTSETAPPIPDLTVRTLAVEGLDLFGATPVPGTPLPPPLPQDAAYTIYTSGSTGRPKGVDLTHASLMNLLLSMARRLDSGPDDVWLGLTSLSFDISALELFLPQVVGARVVVVPDDAVYDGAELLALIRQEGVTHAQATPSAWRMLLAAGFAERDVTALCGGEPLPPDLARDLADRSARLLNVYGPTETTIWSTAGTVPRGTERISIGRPLDNTAVYLLDEDLDPVPLGAVGELYIGGSGLAQGYRHRPALTAERFRPDPFGPAGARIYGTGDRARYLDDGTIEVLGRVDNQVKIRGHRIELGEIEACLLAHEQVGQAAVAPRTVDGAPRLVAYCTPADARPVDPVAVRRHLLDFLPTYMVPSVVVPLERLPLTPNGKIDRKALPDPRDALAPARDDASEAVPPSTRTERLLAEAWAYALDVERVGVHENFFELGGDSLRTIQVAASARRAGLLVGPRDLFTHPTVAELAAALDAGRRHPAEPANTRAAEPVLARLAREHGIAAAAAVLITGGEVTSRQMIGVDEHTPFQVGSLSKHVTALAALRLAEQGRLQLDAPIDRYQRTWRLPETVGGVPVTTRQLLAHTAGLDVRGAAAYPPDSPLPTLGEVLRGQPPSLSPAVTAKFAAGREHRYSATHYTVLQQLLEDVTGTPFAELVGALVFEPLGMTHSGFDGPGFPRPDQRPAGRCALPESAATGLWSTVGDLARLAVEIHRAAVGAAGALLGARSVAELLDPVPGHEYALGTVVRRVGGRRWIGHHGDTPGFRSLSVIDPEAGDGLVVTVADDRGADLIRDLMAELRLAAPAGNPSSPRD